MKTHLDSLNLMSIQHELAMNIGLNPKLVPMIRSIMKICLRRLSIRRIHLFLRHNEDDTIPAETFQGPDQSFYFFMPAGNHNDIMQIPVLGDWISNFFHGDTQNQQVEIFNDADLCFHAYPLSNAGILILERVHGPLPESLLNALFPVFDRLRKACQASMDHERVILEVDKRRRAEKRIEHLAYHDDLTGLPNRRDFLKQINTVNESDNNKQFSALLYIGLDNFSDINDSLGYPFGNALINQIANRLSIQCMLSNSIARVGGDEFGLLYSNISSTNEDARHQAIELARTVQECIEKPNEIKGRSITVAASTGILIFGNNYGDADTILSKAGSALRRAKSLGRNSLHFYHESMSIDVEHRLSLDAEMRTAISKNEFKLYLQPQVNDKGKFIGAEALIRWSHPTRGLISPDTFIPMAEKSGFIMPLSDWVLRRACNMIKSLNKAGIIKKHEFLAVNLSAKQFHQVDFVSRVLSIIEQTGISPHNLELEITESTLLGNVEDTIIKMKKLREAGIRFSIDDFGTGYSSLSYIKSLPFDRIKIDRAFITDVDSSPDDAAIVDIIISMARHFDLNVIAEGVETRAEFNFLRGMGCREFQGFLFYKPMPLEDILALYNTSKLTLSV